MIKFFPAKAFFKIVSNNDNVEEIDYIKVSDNGDFFIEKHTPQGVQSIKLVEEGK